MEKLITVQKREKLNDVYAIDGKGNGWANHSYVICDKGCNELQGGKNHLGILAEIKFQNGARNEKNSIHGVIDTDLLEIVRHRLHCFQNGKFATQYNEKALEHLEIALMYMNRRVEDRIERNVLRTMNK